MKPKEIFADAVATSRQSFEVKETAITHSDGHFTVNKTTKVTGKGQQYFINKFLSESVKID